MGPKRYAWCFVDCAQMLSYEPIAAAVREAGEKISRAARGIARGDGGAWVHRLIYCEVAERAKTRGAAYWDRLFPGQPPEERARRRIRRMLIRGTIAGALSAAGTSAAELFSIGTEGLAAPVAIPLGLVCVSAELLYTTALQIDLAFDLASIYGVPFETDDVGEISTMLAMGLGVELVREPTRHDKPAASSQPGATKRWRVVRQMRRADFAEDVGAKLLQTSVLRNVVPILGILVSAVWNHSVLRKFAWNVHTIVRERSALVRACRGVQLGEPETARRIVDGAWLLATADGELDHAEALAVAALLDTLAFPERMPVSEASFCDDPEQWFDHLNELDETDRDRLMEVLTLVAAADGDVRVPELRFLRRAAKTLGRTVDTARIERICAQLRSGVSPKPETVHADQLAGSGAPSAIQA